MAKHFTNPAIYIMAFFAVSVSLYALSYYAIGHNFLSSKGNLVNVAYWRLAFYTHVTSGAVALGIGWFQFLKKFRARNIRRHRFIGKMYVLAIVFFASTSGMVLAFHADEGLPAQLGFGCLSFVWFYTTLRAWLAIQNGDVFQHRAWITRSYALTMAAVTLRIWLPLALTFKLSFHYAYPAIAWFCWVPNILVTEWFILPRTVKSAAYREPARDALLEA
ncbi:MAG TPA: DUF2306 domain-containing protein [Chitinophagaceae bacterium]|nr:DUF2306 domain-containing protein [Chitinophagaceae bacterium]